MVLPFIDTCFSYSLSVMFSLFSFNTHLLRNVPWYNCIPISAKMDNMKPVRIITSLNRLTASNKAPTMVFKPVNAKTIQLFYCKFFIIIHISVCTFILFHIFYLTMSAGLRIHWMYSLQRGKALPINKKKVSFDDVLIPEFWSTCFGSLLSSILFKWPAHLKLCWGTISSMPRNLDFSKMNLFGRWCLHLSFSI